MEGELQINALKNPTNKQIARSADGLSREVPAARMWSLVLVAVPLLLASILVLPGIPRPDLIIAGGLALFALPFGVNSSLHSYLILASAGSEKAAEDVGFYYAANATGRLVGIMLSGMLNQLGGMTACLLGSAAMLAACWLVTLLSPGSIGGRIEAQGSAASVPSPQ